jgi:hypothetical protein
MLLHAAPWCSMGMRWYESIMLSFLPERLGTVSADKRAMLPEPGWRVGQASGAPSKITTSVLAQCAWSVPLPAMAFCV